MHFAASLTAKLDLSSASQRAVRESAKLSLEIDTLSSHLWDFFTKLLSSEDNRSFASRKVCVILSENGKKKGERKENKAGWTIPLLSMGASDEGEEDGAFERVDAAGDKGLEDDAQDDSVCTADVEAGVGDDCPVTSLLSDASCDGGFDGPATSLLSDASCDGGFNGPATSLDAEEDDMGFSSAL